VETSSYAFVQGMRGTRETLVRWNRRPGPVLATWAAGSLAAALLLLGAVLVIGYAVHGSGSPRLSRPPFRVGAPGDVVSIFSGNLLVLALHAMACVAGFIAGSSLPLQAQEHRGLSRVIHERGGQFAILFVVAATTFSLSAQAYVLGTSVANVAGGLHISPGLLLLALLPHAIPELTALFLPLAAWILASRRQAWGELLAATLVTVALALPVLVLTALWEVYLAPHILRALTGA
jgi:hypothetical protein